MTLVLLIAVPFGAALLLLVSGDRLRRGVLGALGTVALAFAFGIALAIGQAFAAGKTSLVAEIGQWLPLRGADLALRVEPTAVPLLLGITGIGTLLALAGASEPRKRAGAGRLFFALETLVGGALIVVSGRDLVLVLLGWGAVGLATALLAGHERQTAEGAIAGVRALVFARASDVALLFGTLALLALFRTVDLAEISARVAVSDPAPAADGALLAASLAIVAAILIRTAQLPVHLWILGGPRGPAAARAAVASIATLSGAALLLRLAPALHPWSLAGAAAIGAIGAVVGMACALAYGGGRRGQAWTTVAELGAVVAVAAAAPIFAGLLIALATALARGAALVADVRGEPSPLVRATRVPAAIASVAIFFMAGLFLGHDRAGLALPVLAAATLASAQLGRALRRRGPDEDAAHTQSSVIGPASAGRVLGYLAPLVAMVLALSSLAVLVLAPSGDLSLGAAPVASGLGPVGIIAIVVALIAFAAGLRGVALPAIAARRLRGDRATELLYDRGLLALVRLVATTIDRGAEAAIELGGQAVGLILSRASIGLRAIGSGSVWRQEAIFVAAAVAIALYWTLR